MKRFIFSILALLLCLECFAQDAVTRRRAVYISGEAVLLLDEDGLSASAGAWSISRDLTSTNSVDAIRVRRESDNTEQDIGYSSGVLDQSALTTFVGSTNGFIVKIYDHSGNARDLTETTASDQPIIVSAGVVETKNGQPCAVFDGAGDRVTASWTEGHPTSRSFVFSQETWVSVSWLFGGTGKEASVWQQEGGSPTLTIGVYSSGRLNITGPALGSQGIIQATFNGTSQRGRVNGASFSSATAPAANTNPNGLMIGRYYAVGGWSAEMTFQEGVVFDELTSDTNMDTIRSNQNAYYSTY